jgi:hypothetical protein
VNRPVTSTKNSNVTNVPTRLAAKLDKRLIAYAAAASAAGVGLFTQSAEAKVVYTAANTKIGYNQNANLDLNHDGVADFILSLQFGQGRRYPEGGFDSLLAIYAGQAGNEVWGVQSAKGWECAAALPAGVKVGAGAAFQQQYLQLFNVAGSYTRGDSEHCPCDGLRRGAFLGLKFMVNGLTHYGWAHVTVINVTSTVLDGYAYETVPNQAIDTGKTSGPVSIAELDRMPLPPPQPATLGALAQGSRGLDLWRRPEDEQRSEQPIVPTLG